MTDEFKLTDEQRDKVLAMIEGEDPQKAFTYGKKRFLRLLNEAVNKYRDEGREISSEDIKHVFDTTFYHLGRLVAGGCTVKIKNFGKFEPNFERNGENEHSVELGIDFTPSKWIFDERGFAYWFRLRMLENYAKHEGLFAYAD